MAVDPAKTYHGKPCKNCGETLKWKSVRCCVLCQRGWRRVLYYRRKQAGLCVKCGAPRLSDAYCWDCLNKKEAQRALTL